MAISNYESGEDKPQPERVRQLAEQLKFPIEFFSKKPWEGSIEPVFWRSRAAETKYAREITKAHEMAMRDICVSYGKSKRPFVRASCFRYAGEFAACLLQSTLKLLRTSFVGVGDFETFPFPM